MKTFNSFLFAFAMAVALSSCAPANLDDGSIAGQRGRRAQQQQPAAAAAPTPRPTPADGIAPPAPSMAQPASTGPRRFVGCTNGVTPAMPPTPDPAVPVCEDGALDLNNRPVTCWPTPDRGYIEQTGAPSSCPCATNAEISATLNDASGAPMVCQSRAAEVWEGGK